MKLESLAFYVTLLKKDFVSYCTKRIKEYGITFNQLFIIICVGKNKDISPKMVSNVMKMDLGQLNRSINKLIDSGYLIQKKNVLDNRANVLNLTEKGTNIFKSSYNFFEEWDNLILEDIDKDTYNQLLKFMNKIATKIYQKKENGENE